MAALSLEAALLWMVFGCAASNVGGQSGSGSAAVRYRLENQLSACVVIERETASWRGDIAVLELRYDLAKSTGECGCKSALSAYSSYAEFTDGERYLMGGALTLSGGDAMTLPLTADKDLLGDAAVRVSLGCEAPD
jgi:hypothetical protein